MDARAPEVTVLRREVEARLEAVARDLEDLRARLDGNGARGMAVTATKEIAKEAAHEAVPERLEAAAAPPAAAMVSAAGALRDHRALAAAVVLAGVAAVVVLRRLL